MFWGVLSYKDTEDILSFWFNDHARQLWFVKDDKFDQKIRERFLKLYQKALAGLYDDWLANHDGILALILLFDQFPRNMFRYDEQAFATDKKALQLSKHAIEKEIDKTMNNKEHLQFLYMPLMHSEDLKDQEISVDKFAKVGKEAYHFACIHKEIIEKFSRFPGRNIALKRKSTKEEVEFLKNFDLF